MGSRCCQRESAIFSALALSDEKRIGMLNRLMNVVKPGIDRQKIMYVLVGVFNTGVGISLFFLLYLLLKNELHYQWITVLAHFLSVLSSWLMYRRFVFKSEASPLLEYVKFNLTSLFMLGFQILGLYLFVDTLHINPMISQPIVVVVGVVVSYIIHAKFTFSRFFS